jgi:hypothetical protein
VLTSYRNRENYDTFILNPTYCNRWNIVVHSRLLCFLNVVKFYFSSFFSYRSKHSPPVTRKSLWEDGCSGAVQGECLLPGEIEGCCWQVLRHARDLHYYTQTDNIKQLRAACSKCTFTVFCGCCDNILDRITGDLKRPSVHESLLSVVCSLAEHILSR